MRALFLVCLSGTVAGTIGAGLTALLFYSGVEVVALAIAVCVVALFLSGAAVLVWVAVRCRSLKEGIALGREQAIEQFKERVWK